MERTCEICGIKYQAQRSTSRYCGSGCRVRATRARQSGGELPRPAAVKPVELVEADRAARDREHRRKPGALEASVLRELEKVNRLDTWQGQQALLLARHLDGGIGMLVDTGSARAAVSKELRTAMEVALADIELANDPVDELRRRRELKLG